MKITLLIILFGFVACKPNSNIEKNKAVIPDAQSFDADGYYFSTDTLRIRQYIFDNLLISTKEKTTNGMKEFPAQMVQLNFTDTANGTRRSIEVKKFHVEKDTLNLEANDSQLGDIMIVGRFLGKNGPCNDNVKETITVVMEATIKIGNYYKHQTNFTWFGGD